MSRNDVVIIGSGLSGLLCGVILAREGLGVTVLEKEPRAGGNLLTFSRNGVNFETGVHYVGSLGRGQTLARYWDWIGLTDRIRTRKLDKDSFDRIAFGEREIKLAQGFDFFRESLLTSYPKDKAAIDEYLKTINQVADAFPLYNLRVPGEHREHQYLSRPARGFFSGLGVLAGTTGITPLGSALAGNNYLYGGCSHAPLSSASLINHSFIRGSYRFIGGSGRIASALADLLKEAGGSLVTGHEVTEIIPSPGTFIVRTRQNRPFNAGRVIAGIHPAQMLAMIPPGHFRSSYRERIAALPNTPSSFILFLGLKPDRFPYPNYNYYFHSGTDPWDEAEIAGNRWPAMYLLSAGCEEENQHYARSVTLLTYMSWKEVSKWEKTLRGKRGDDYEAFKKEKAEKLLDMACRRFPELKQSIAFMEISTPLTYRDYTGTPEGSLYGIQKDYADPVLTTILPRTKIPGLYLTGQNTNLHGVLGVTISAIATCGEILGLEYLLNKITHGTA